MIVAFPHFQVVEVNVKIEAPGDENIHNNAFYAEEKLLKCESEAMRDCDPLCARHWIVSAFLSFLIMVTKIMYVTPWWFSLPSSNGL